MKSEVIDINEFLNQDEKKDLLRILTAGSVDDGKSTLIGRLLFDSKKLYEDQLAALQRDSGKVGNAGEDIDYALLLRSSLVIPFRHPWSTSARRTHLRRVSAVQPTLLAIEFRADH